MEKGKKYGRLIAIKPIKKNKHNAVIWLFKCDCGKTKEIVGSAVKNGSTKSCGCYQKEARYRHNMCFTPTYQTWHSMKTRCLNKKHIAYHRYGGRGIKICDRWRDKDGFSNFVKDMGERPKGKTLDRINNNGNYEPSNCRWATQKEQSVNMKSNRWIKYKGKKKTISQWADDYGIPRTTLHGRLSKGLNIGDALTK